MDLVMTDEQFLSAFQNGILGKAVKVQFSDKCAAIIDGVQMPLLPAADFDMFVMDGELVLGLWSRPDGQRLWLKATLVHDPEFRVVCADESVAGGHDLSLNAAARAPNVSS